MELKICNLGLSQIPPDVWNHTDLQKLDLSGNQLTSLPYQISYLTELRILNVSNNRLTSLPYQISDLTELQDLDVSNNRLTSLPYQISDLTELRKLNVSNNQLTSLPYQISDLTELRILNVSNNQLTSLPYQISDLTELQELNVSNNQLTSLPYQISDLTKLRRLVVNGNQLSSLPSSILQLLSQPGREFSTKNRRSHLTQRAEKNYLDADIEQAEQFLQSGQDRAAGTIAGVALELYLKDLCEQNSVSYSERAGLQSLIQNLEEGDVITSQQANHMMRLSSIRNKCAHSSPITKQEVSLLVREVKKLLD